MGDAEIAIQNNKDEFIHKWTKVMQYYQYVVHHTRTMSDEWFEAVNIVSDISAENPSLEEYVDFIVGEKTQEHSQTSSSVNMDSSALTNQVESYVSEIEHMQSWDPNHIEEIAWQLQACQKKLISNQSSFEPTLYQSLMDDINRSLDKIGRFHDMLHSEAIEDIKRM